MPGAATTSQISHAIGATTPPLLEITIGAALRRAAAEWGDACALVSCAEGLRLSWRELDAQVDRLAAGLLAQGLVPGDRVAIWAPTSAAWTLLQFATARAGLVFVTFNTAYRRSELAHVLALSGARMLVSAAGFKTIDYAAELAAVEAPALQFRVMLDAPPPPGWLAFEALFAPAGTVFEGPDGQPEDPVNIQFTSGTTGRPKGVTLSHRNILNNGDAVGRNAGIGAGDRVCIPVPLFHCFGMVMGNLACLTHGAAMVYPASAFSAEATLRAIADDSCTYCYGVPTMFIAMLDVLDHTACDLSSLRGGIMAGSNCPVEVMRRVQDRMNMREVTIAYGMTETSPVSTQTLPDDPFEARIASVGRVLPHIEIKIVDQAGEIVPRGVQGELCTRGYSVMAGYWNDPEATRRAIDVDGFMHSGDLATMDAEGYVAITGRSKDMIIRGGENISPREIEEHLYTHPAVQDVAVIGVPDEKFGEIVVAWIIVAAGETPSEADILAHCRGVIAHYKVPARVRFVSELPMTPSGKVQKFIMRRIETGGDT
ncbi:AMP-binding protein [Polymorphobacter arshaanensis]|uniref:3-methylmercaptopropionyl-CoA ligase n=2 Tax=Glacieibacterium arshaanense TaxID=2511025 RepID=A0A4Y9ESI3_9SPHN|nr:AMP-binding protein [Polymorphobacter arshaanensis]